VNIFTPRANVDLLAPFVELKDKKKYYNYEHVFEKDLLRMKIEGV
jgi:hypothetical protein